MKSLLPALLGAAVVCAGCTSPGTPTSTSSRAPTKPAYCLEYSLCSAGQCEALSAQACPIECTNVADGQPPACAPSMSCEMTKTANYHACLGRCAAIPFECR